MSAVLRLGWDRIEDLVEGLASQLAGAGVAFDRLLVVARGGLVPGGLLAGRLDIACVETLQVQAYTGRERRAAPVVVGRAPAPAGPSGDATRTLVFDELLESGGTLACIAALLPQAERAVLVVKGALHGESHPAPGRVRPHVLAGAPHGDSLWAVEVVPADRWVVFPWTPPSER